MPGNPYDSLDTRHISEGRADDVLHKRAIHNAGRDSSPPTFFRYVILDVISDPSTLDDKKLSYYENVLGVSNIHYASVAPRNSIIAQRVLSAAGSASEKVMVLYPFFPPHMAFPAKPGEHVWAMFENPAANEHSMGYWMCRIVQPNFVEDVNYTHSDRQFDPTFLPGLSDTFEGSDAAVYEFRNGAVDTKDGQRYTIVNTISLPSGDNVETAYSDLLSNSDASKQTTYEPVPRYRKRPADIAFEGSNNTLIVLGTDRSTAISDYTDDSDKGKLPKPFPSDVQGNAGSIDMVAGRGQTDDTSGKSATNQPLGNKELAKDGKSVQPKEGDTDLINDRSRLLIAQKTKVDTNFKIDAIVSAHASQTPITDGDGEGAIVIKSDKIRLVARHDVILLVNGASDKDSNGNVKDPGSGGSSVDPDKCASIIMRTNGDIVFTPSKTGLIRLGGDDASLSPLCTRVGNSPGMTGPVPPPTPIVDTMGGSQGGADGVNGTFPMRVLMK